MLALVGALSANAGLDARGDHRVILVLRGILFVFAGLALRRAAA